MGREVKRVSLDFDWNLNKVWAGYLNPFYAFYQDCKYCDGSGSSPKFKELEGLWYGYTEFKPEDNGSVPFEFTEFLDKAKHNLSFNNPDKHTSKEEIEKEAKRLCTFFNSHWSNHLNDEEVTLLLDEGRLFDFKDSESPPSTREVNLWSTQGIGHCSINKWIITQHRCKKEGFEIECPHCKGEGGKWHSEEIEKKYNDWEPTEPPEGEGYQIWENVSEGSPISPVFKTPEELADYMKDTRWGADKGTSYETWLKFITSSSGYAPSLVVSDGKVSTGVQYTSDNKKE